MLFGLPGASQNGFSFRQMFASGLVGGLGGAASYHAMRSAMKVCFAAGTPIRTAGGWRKIEQIAVDDWVFVREGLLTRLRRCARSG